MRHISAVPVKGLLPLIDPRVAGQFYIYDGRNVIVDFKGPRSGFGNRISTWAELVDPEYCEDIEIEGEIYIFTSKLVLRHDTESDLLYVAFEFEATYDAIWPWTSAKVGNKYFFIKSGMSKIIVYNPVTYEWKEDALTGLPENPAALCDAQGRLVVIGTDRWAWSAVSDGEDLDPAGGLADFESHSLLGGIPLRVLPNAEGFTVYTTEGTGRMVLTGSVIPYTFLPMDNPDVLINPFAVVRRGQNHHIYMARSGLFFANAGRVEAYQSLFGEYLAEQVLPFLDLDDFGVLRMMYSDTRKLLFISKSDNAASALYAQAWVLNVARDEWGTFDRNHYSIGRFAFTEQGRGFYDLGFVCDNGRVHKFDNTYAVQTWNTQDGAVLWRDNSFEIPARVTDDATIFSSRARMTGFDPSRYSNVETGWYTFQISTSYEKDPSTPANVIDISPYTDYEEIDWETASTDEDWETDSGDEDWTPINGYEAFVFKSAGYFSSAFHVWNLVVSPDEYVGLDAYARVGPFRLPNEMVNDATSQILDISVGMEDTSPAEFVDWQIASIDEDWETASGEDDWDGVVLEDYTYKITLHDTNDASILNQVQATIPALKYQKGSTRFYGSSNGVSAVFHYVGIEATDFGEAFHIRALELTALDTGRL